jgi:nucleotide-binding universal stress UspA family protein
MASKILIPYDASQFSNDAFNEALIIAKKFDAKLEALCVLGSAVKDRDVISLSTAIQLQDEQEDEATKIFKDLEKISKDEGVRFSFSVIYDPDPSKGIVNYANSNDFDLIVIGSHGRTGLRKKILGSVAYGVVEYAKCPVLIIKNKK